MYQVLSFYHVSVSACYEKLKIRSFVSNQDSLAEAKAEARYLAQFSVCPNVIVVKRGGGAFEYRYV
jgi:hypothetical protein